MASDPSPCAPLPNGPASATARPRTISRMRKACSPPWPPPDSGVWSKRRRAAQAEAGSDAHAQQIAAGLGYIDFALENPALFRLMFTSEKPDRTVPDLGDASIAAYEKLQSGVRSVVGENPPDDPGAMKLIMASWATAHGLADLIVSGRAERP